MAITGVRVGVSCSPKPNCIDVLGCPKGVCPDFLIRRHDTQPPFRVLVEDCDGPLDLTDENLIVEVNMWAKAKLKKAINACDDYFALADNIGFDQIMVGDVIVMDRVRNPERMLVVAFDEHNKFVKVERGHQDTEPVAWKKGTMMKIIRVISSGGSIESDRQDVLQIDGTTAKDQLVSTHLVYNWKPTDVCLPGCYWLEFKLLKMIDLDPDGDGISVSSISNLSFTCPDVPSIISCDPVSNVPSFTPSTIPECVGCFLGTGVEWVRRFPVDGEGFLIKIVDSPTRELV